MVLTNVGMVLTNVGVVLTNIGALLTNAGVLLTNAGVPRMRSATMPTLTLGAFVLRRIAAFVSTGVDAAA